MSIKIGNSVVTKGLVLCLDASSEKNYVLSEVEVLVVAGGGGGGANHAGGGGAGGLIYNSSYSVTPGSSINVTVGNGGSRSTSHTSTPAGDGQNSIFGTLTAIGGGGGGNRRDAGTAGLEFGRPGGSGGGGGGQGTDNTPTSTGGSGVLGQGNRGGTASYHAGAGGGGAGGPGQTTSGSLGGATATTFPGNGGPGLCFTISGSPRYYAGGGGGSGWIGGPFAGVGGSGIGGDGQIDGSQRVNGTANTGSGGGGANGGGNTNGGSGGSGVVIVRYPGTQKATGGAITNVGGYTIHTFNTSATFTPLTEAQIKSTIYGLQDLSTYTNSGVKVGTITYSSSNSGSLVFDGVNGTLNCGNSDVINFGEGDFTISIWFTRRSSATTNLRLLSKAAGSDTANAASAGFSFFGADSGISFAVNPTAARTIIGAASYSLNEWVNVVGLVERGVSMRTYKNGSLVASTAAPSGSVSGTTNLFVGSNTGSNLFWNGEIANVSIYNRALTLQEIQQNFNALRGRFGI